jgi:ankyrin repeat protein
MDAERLETLWNRLLEAFRTNDSKYVAECVKLRAPLDRQNDVGDFPVHMAARLGKTEVVSEVFGKHPEQTAKRLLQVNKSKQSALEVAIQADKMEAADLITTLILETREQISTKSEFEEARILCDRLGFVILSALDKAIKAEQDRVSTYLITNLDNLRTQFAAPTARNHLGLGGAMYEMVTMLFLPTSYLESSRSGCGIDALWYKIFWTCISYDNIRGAETIISKIKKKGLMNNFFEQFSKLDEDEFPDGFSDNSLDLSRCKWIWIAILFRELRESMQHMDKNKWKDTLLQNIVARLSNVKRRSPLRGKESVSLESNVLDRAFAIFKMQHSPEDLNDYSAQIEHLFRQKGARNWTACLGAVERMDIAEIERMIEAESNTSLCERMVNASAKNYMSPLQNAIRLANNAQPEHPVEGIHRLIELLLQNGASLTFPGKERIREALRLNN